MCQVTTGKILDDLRSVLNHAEDLLRATAGEAGGKAAEVREKAEASLHAARARLAEAGQDAADGLHRAGRKANEHVHRNPWAAIGVGVAAGLLIGVLLGRRDGGRP